MTESTSARPVSTAGSGCSAVHTRLRARLTEADVGRAGVRGTCAAVPTANARDVNHC
ncbi:hypothetical protein [Micromonospora sp. LH3U1]|uniref:hypothetical protein n=1 Tax=Micromonospora sp. LH3U1 TaxID=3018339 RepID=UPI00234BDD86|nr:hypothetical protein [Micromonospora sp. LH3U1]WCN83279.1 hypothetical protein PCA76_09600 [Micromonospora sp. LH3U1]